ncbi:hypothetical protein NDN08_008120 [Rhodosorus marinus]|uniref:Uncharacterized protein n=1 Tax=Rhodosorus marinus TaxID=101924 RepID=A0AAV8V2B6_9RHOD|nr:hypothetical protein NDN08_008120 [Rhodosorus marinus]
MSYAVKRLLFRVISSYLDEYAESRLSRDQLYFDIRNGCIDLKDVQLKPGRSAGISDLSAVFRLRDFPLSIRSGGVESIKVQISWAIGGKIKVHVKNLHLCLEEVGENDLIQFTTADWIGLEATRKGLLADALNDQYVSNQGTATAGWRTTLLKRLVNSFELEVNDAVIEIYTKAGTRFELFLSHLTVSSDNLKPNGRHSISKELSFSCSVNFGDMPICKLEAKANIDIQQRRGSPFVKVQGSISSAEVDCSVESVSNALQFLKRASQWKRRLRCRVFGRPAPSGFDLSTAPTVGFSARKWWVYAQQCAIYIAKGMVLTEESILRRKNLRTDYFNIYALAKMRRGQLLTASETLEREKMEATMTAIELACLRYRTQKEMRLEKKTWWRNEESEERRLILSNLVEQDKAMDLQEAVSSFSVQINLADARLALRNIAGIRLAGLNVSMDEQGVAAKLEDVWIETQQTGIRHDPHRPLLSFSSSSAEQSLGVSPFLLSLQMNTLRTLLRDLTRLMKILSASPDILPHETVAYIVLNEARETAIVCEGGALSISSDNGNVGVSDLMTLEFSYLSMRRVGVSTRIRVFGFSSHAGYRRVLQPADVYIHAVEQKQEYQIELWCKEINFEVVPQHLVSVAEIMLAVAAEPELEISGSDHGDESPTSTSPTSTSYSLALKVEALSLDMLSMATLQVSRLQLRQESSGTLEGALGRFKVFEPRQRKRGRWDQDILILGHDGVPSSSNAATASLVDGVFTMQTSAVHVNLCVPVIMAHTSDIMKQLNTLASVSLPPSSGLGEGEFLTEGDEKQALVDLTSSLLHITFELPGDMKSQRLEVVARKLVGVDCCLRAKALDVDEIIYEQASPSGQKRTYLYLTIVGKAFLDLSKAINDSWIMFTLLLDLFYEGAVEEEIPEAMSLHVAAPFLNLSIPKFYDRGRRSLLLSVIDLELQHVEEFDMSRPGVKTVSVKMTSSVKTSLRGGRGECGLTERVNVDLTVAAEESSSGNRTKTKLSIPEIHGRLDMLSLVSLSAIFDECILTIPPTKDTVVVTSTQSRQFFDDFSVSVGNVLVGFVKNGGDRSEIIRLFTGSVKFRQKEKKQLSSVDVQRKIHASVGEFRISDSRPGVVSEELRAILTAVAVTVDVEVSSRLANTVVNHKLLASVLPIDLVNLMKSQFSEQELSLVPASDYLFKSRITDGDEHPYEQEDKLQLAPIFRVVDDEEDEDSFQIAPVFVKSNVAFKDFFPIEVCICDSTLSEHGVSVAVTLVDLSYSDDGFSVGDLKVFLCTTEHLMNSVNRLTCSKEAVLTATSLSLAVTPELVVQARDIKIVVCVAELKALQEFIPIVQDAFQFGEINDADAQGEQISEFFVPQGEMRLRRVSALLLNSRQNETIWALRVMASMDGSANRTSAVGSCSLKVDLRPPWGGWNDVLSETRFSLRQVSARSWKARMHDSIRFTVSGRVFELLAAVATALGEENARTALLDPLALGTVNSVYYLCNQTGLDVLVRGGRDGVESLTVKPGGTIELDTEVLGVSVESVAPEFQLNTLHSTKSVLTLHTVGDLVPVQLSVRRVKRGAARIVQLSSGVHIRNDSHTHLWIRPSHDRNVRCIPPQSAFNVPVGVPELAVGVFISIDGIYWSPSPVRFKTDRTAEIMQVDIKTNSAVRVLSSASSDETEIVLTPTLIIENRLPDELLVEDISDGGLVKKLAKSTACDMFMGSRLVRLRAWGHFWSVPVDFFSAPASGSLKIVGLELCFNMREEEGLRYVRIFAPMWFSCDLERVGARITTEDPGSGGNLIRDFASRKGGNPLPIQPGDGFWIRIGRSRWSQQLRLRNPEEGNGEPTFELLTLEEPPKVVLSDDRAQESRVLSAPGPNRSRWYRAVLLSTPLTGADRGITKVTLLPLIEIFNGLEGHSVLVAEAGATAYSQKLASGVTKGLEYFTNAGDVILTCKIDALGWEWSSSIRLEEGLEPNRLKETVLRLRNSSTGQFFHPRLSVERTVSGTVRACLLDEVQLVVPFQIHNACRFDIRVSQVSVFDGSLFLIPGAFGCYAWDEPGKEKLLELHVKVSTSGSHGRFLFACQIDPVRRGSVAFEQDGDIPSVTVTVNRTGEIHVITISDTSLVAPGTDLVPYNQNNMLVASNKQNAPSLGLQVDAPGVEVSLADDDRRELIVATWAYIKLAYERRLDAQQAELWVGNFDVETCGEHGRTIAGRANSGNRRGLDIPKNVLHAAVSWMTFGPEMGALYMTRLGVEHQPIRVDGDAKTVLDLVRLVHSWWVRLKPELRNGVESEQEKKIRWRSVFVSTMEIKPLEFELSLTSSKEALEELQELGSSDSIEMNAVMFAIVNAVTALLNSFHARLRFGEVSLRRLCTTPEDLAERVLAIYRESAFHPNELNLSLDFARPFQAAFRWLRDNLFDFTSREEENLQLSRSAAESMRRARDSIASSTSSIGMLAALDSDEPL